MFVIGRGRYARESYPERVPGLGAFQDRALAPVQNLGGFTPATNPSASLIAATLVTPKASGIFMVLGSSDLINGAGADIYGLVVHAFTGPGLTVSGGSVTVDGWTMGTTVPPVIGGTPTPQLSPMSLATQSIGAAGAANLAIAGFNTVPLPLGVPSVIEVLLGEIGGGNALATVGLQIGIIELP